MGHLAQFILALPVEQIKKFLILTRALDDPKHKDILQSLLMSAAKKHELPNDQLFIDDMITECEKFNNQLIEAWKKHHKEIFNEDHRLPIISQLLRYDNLTMKMLEKKLEELAYLYMDFNYGETANTFTSLYSACKDAQDRLLKKSQSISVAEEFQEVVKELQEKEQQQKPEQLNEKWQMLINKMKIYASLYKYDHGERVELLCTLDKKIKNYQESLESCIKNFLNDTQFDYFINTKNKNPYRAMIVDLNEESSDFCQFCLTHPECNKALAVYSMILALQYCLYDKGKDVAHRLRLFQDIFSEHYKKLKEETGKEEVNHAAREFLHDIEEIFAKQQMLFAVPIKIHKPSRSMCMFNRALNVLGGAYAQDAVSTKKL